MLDVLDTGNTHAGTTLYLVRHGQTEYNRQSIVQGRRIDSTLNDTGRAQAEALGQRFAQEPLDALYASTMQRARQTVGAVARHHAHLDVQYEKDFEELSWGRFEGQSSREDPAQAHLDAVKAEWRAGRFDEAVEEGESARAVQQRGLRGLRRVLEAHAGASVLIVAHGRFLRVLIASLLAEYGLENMHRIEHSNTGVNCLRWGEDEVCTASLLNCTAHLDHRPSA